MTYKGSNKQYNFEPSSKVYMEVYVIVERTNKLIISY